MEYKYCIWTDRNIYATSNEGNGDWNRVRITIKRIYFVCWNSLQSRSDDVFEWEYRWCLKESKAIKLWFSHGVQMYGHFEFQ